MSYRGGVPAMLLLLAVALFLHHTAQAQVTFSRDWTAGKRAAGTSMTASDCSANGRSVAALCHMLLGELRQLANCELRSQMSSISRDDDSAIDVAPATGNSFPLRSGR